jgi:hypothetical protein
MGRKVLKQTSARRYNPAMSKILGKAVLAALALALVATSLHAQGRNRREQRRPAEPAAPTVPTDKRDSLVGAPGPYSGRPYWLALAECGGIYFKLNVLYTDVAVRARVVKPDPRVNAEYTKKLTEAIKTATIFFNGAERFLMTDRGLERADAVLAYDGSSRAAADRVKTMDAGQAAVQSCPALYQACHDAFSKQCSELLSPAS